MTNKSVSVSRKDLAIFAESELLRALLTVEDGHAKRYLTQIHNELAKLFEKTPLFSSNVDALQTINHFGTTKDFKPFVLRFIAVFEVGYYVNHMIYFDYDTKQHVLLTKQKFKALIQLTDMKKSDMAKAFRFLEENVSLNYSTVDLSNTNYALVDSVGISPNLTEIIDLLSDSNDVKQLIMQVFAAVTQSYRFSKQIIVLSGSKTRKRLFRKVLEVLTKGRMVSVTTKSLMQQTVRQKLAYAKAIYYRSELETDDQLADLMSHYNSLLIIDETFFKNKDLSHMVVPLNRNELDDSEYPLQLIETKDCQEKISEQLHSELAHYRFNRYITPKERENGKLTVFIHYLRDLSLLGCSAIPVSLAYLLYETYCEKNGIENEYRTKAAFTKELTQELNRLNYILSPKTERIKAILSRDAFQTKLISDLCKENGQVQLLIEANQVTRVYVLGESSGVADVEQFEEKLYHISDIGAKNRWDDVMGVIVQRTDILSMVERFSPFVCSLIDDTILQSSFLTHEFVQLLAIELLLICEEEDFNGLSDRVKDEIRTLFSNVESIVAYPMTVALKKALLNRLYDDLEHEKDVFVMATRQDALDKALVDCLTKRLDARISKVVEQFKTSVSKKQKSVFRKRMIDFVAKNYIL